jgi:ribulose-phosphate 3-epimerase
LRAVTDLVLDVHLMIENPEKYIEPFVKAGADLLTVHYEATLENTEKVISLIKSYGIMAGLSIKPNTQPDKIEKFIPLADLILVMTVEPGFGGQKLIPETIDKVREVRSMLNDRNLTTDIQVDGGVNDANAMTLVGAGANVIVAGSAVFKGNASENASKFLKTMGN